MTLYTVVVCYLRLYTQEDNRGSIHIKVDHSREIIISAGLGASFVIRLTVLICNVMIFLKKL